MWHMSFYGYLPYQQDECFDDMFDGIEKKKMRAKLYGQSLRMSFRAVKKHRNHQALNDISWKAF